MTLCSNEFERALLRFWSSASLIADDPAHDIGHVRRVVRWTRLFAKEEAADIMIAEPAAWLHDLVNLPKDNPDRTHASRLSATQARIILTEMDYPSRYHDAIAHAIEAHSFSAGIAPVTIEARIVQDADRLEALGAIGIARCFSTGGGMRRALWHESDPLARERDADDRAFTLDHFFVKLFKLPATFQTEAGRAEAQKRVGFMQDYIATLADDLAAA